MKRVSYGFRDERCFQLRLYALHDCRVTPKCRMNLNFPSILCSRVRARQAVSVFSLHLFTRMPQMVVSQRVRGEGFLFLGSRW